MQYWVIITSFLQTINQSHISTCCTEYFIIYKLRKFANMPGLKNLQEKSIYRRHVWLENSAGKGGNVILQLNWPWKLSSIPSVKWPNFYFHGQTMESSLLRAGRAEWNIYVNSRHYWHSAAGIRREYCIFLLFLWKIEV